MAKDAKGHGSNARGAVMDRLAAARSNPNHPLGALSRVVSQGTPIAGVEANKQAASELAQGNPKAAPPPVHGGATGRHDYNPKSVNDAIASSNRAGRRIGGREAKLIHRLMRGR